jgi:CelD/BcsL family acetyltransferase involved in cellulose biosynthesis
MVKVIVIDSTQDFADLEGKWEDLQRNSSLAIPYQWWAWLYSWWEFCGESYELRLVTVWGRTLLVGLAPLMLDRRWGFGRLLFIGTGITDYLDILVRRGWERQFTEAGRRVLGQMDCWHVMDLQQLRPEAAAWSLFKNWSGPRTCIWQDNTPTLPVKTWKEMLKHVDRKLRSNVRGTLRRAEADGVRVELAGIDDVEQAAHNMVVLGSLRELPYPVLQSPLVCELGEHSSLIKSLAARYRERDP